MYRLGSERDAFRLYHQNLYYGNAGDSMYSHNGLPFSTFDVDNDNRDGDFAERSCARLYKVITKNGTVMRRYGGRTSIGSTVCTYFARQPSK